MGGTGVKIFERIFLFIARVFAEFLRMYVEQSAALKIFENFLLLGGYLRLRFWGLFFGRAYFWEGLLSEFYCILDNVGQYLKTPVEIGRK